MEHLSFTITEALIRRNVTDRTFARGWEYYDDGLVHAIHCRDGVLYADVQGSGDEPYRVAVRPGAAGGVSAECDCPYDYEGWCKHIVAALIFALETPGEVEEKPSVAALIAAADVDVVKRLLTELAALDPSVADMIEMGLKTKRRVSLPKTI